MTDAVVREEDGELVLDDPVALAFVRAVSKHNCQWLIESNTKRLTHFKSRITALGKSPQDVVIVLLNVDDPQAAEVAEVLMPGHNWQEYRDRGETPVARGLAGRSGIQEVLDELDPEAGKKLRAIEGVAVVVMDHNVAEAYPYEET